MISRPMTFMLHAAALLLLAAPLPPAHALASYDVKATGVLTIDTLTGSVDLTPDNDPPDSFTQTDPPGYATASSLGQATPLTGNSVEVQSAVSGTALPYTGYTGSTSFADAYGFGGFLITNNGTDAVTLLASVDVSWIWTLLVDDALREFAGGEVGVDVFIDDPTTPYESLVFNLNLNPPNSDGANFTWQLDLTDPLATLGPGQSRSIWVGTYAAGAAAYVPEPGTLPVLLAGLAGIAALRRRQAV